MHQFKRKKILLLKMMGRKLVVSKRGHVQSVRGVSDSNKCKCEQNG